MALIELMKMYDFTGRTVIVTGRHRGSCAGKWPERWSAGGAAVAILAAQPDKRPIGRSNR